MMSSTLVILVSVTTVAILSGEASAALPTQCNTGFLEELPPRLRKLCFAIARLWDARDSNDFVDDSGKRSSSESYLAHPRFIKLFLLFFKAVEWTAGTDNPTRCLWIAFRIPREPAPVRQRCQEARRRSCILALWKTTLRNGITPCSVSQAMDDSVPFRSFDRLSSSTRRTFVECKKQQKKKRRKILITVAHAPKKTIA